jgi:hypothetical protein
MPQVDFAANHREILASLWITENQKKLVEMDTPGSNEAWRALAAIILTEKHAMYLARHEPRLLEQCQKALLSKGEPKQEPKS